jgi:hypothetical protein
MSAVAYALVGREDASLASEVERTDAEVVAVTLSWGEGAARTVVAVRHLEGQATLTVGEGEGCDLVIPEAVLGAATATLLRREGTKLVLCPPAGATMKLDGWPCKDATVELAWGHVAEIAIGAFCVRIALEAAAKTAPLAPPDASPGLLGSFAGSTLLHAAVIGAAALFVGVLGKNTMRLEETESHWVDTFSMQATAEPEFERHAVDTPNGDPGGTEPSAKTEEVSKFVPTNNGTPGRASWSRNPAIPGEHSPEAVQLQAVGYGAIKILKDLYDRNGRMLDFGPDADGDDDVTHRGHMFNPQPGEVFGSNLSGGPNWNDPAYAPRRLSRIAGLGNCLPSQNCIGTGHDFPRPDHAVTPISMRPAVFDVGGGGLSREVVQRAIQLHYQQFTGCYQIGVQQNPSLTGYVRVGFQIGRNGGVTAVFDQGSSMPDPAVKSCVISTFAGISFPPPKDGTVTVQYGFTFSPSNA